jgi:uncharacterized protein (DUF1330 family)
MSNATLIVSGRVKNLEKVAAYRQKAVLVLKKYGAILPPKSRIVTTVLAGSSKPESLLEVEFEFEQNIIDAFSDPEYLSIIQLRDEGFEDLSIYIVK